MATITLKGNPIHTFGELPAVGSKAPEFSLTSQKLQDHSLAEFAGKKVVLNIYPSVDTGTCAMSVRQFNAAIAEHPDAVCLCISRDLPFAAKRFCGAEGLDNVLTLSVLRDLAFGEAYGVQIIDGPMAGLLSRSVVVVDAEGTVVYTEQVAETTHEPNYAAALAALNG
ncbi:MAG: thiol peroxidase [Myxococcales bacterium]|nr:thiol peroxidase [Myxococcales bacterium]